MKNLPIQIKILGGFLIIMTIIGIFNTILTRFENMYNISISNKIDYETISQRQVTTWDNNYLAFKEKSNVTDLNKETFLMVTDIIMSARKDGQNVAWKWVSENQNIPFQEFTVFYKDLNSFVTNKYNENKEFEKQKQDIVNNHNKIIRTFPNNIYNRFLHIEPMVYKEGFISDSTRKLFNL